MQPKRINSLPIIRDHVKELHQQYTATTDPRKKEMLEKRVRNLYNVLRFLSGGEEGAGNIGNFA